MTKTSGMEVAIIGMAARFPQSGSIEEFWKNLAEGNEAVVSFDKEELRQEGVPENILNQEDYIPARGYLEASYAFDPVFFGYSPKEAEVMDPQMRLLHQCVWHALEDAGYDPFTYDKPIGLFAGAGFNFMWRAGSLVQGNYFDLESFDADTLINRDFLTTKISYCLNLTGPSFLMQNACSTSLVAVHQAYRALLTGECRIALAGGVSLAHPPKQGYVYREGMIMSADGHCKAFDVEASGTVGGSGAGVVALKMLTYAQKERDHVYALILGSAVNNDGRRKAGFAAPSVTGQAEVIRKALRMARVEPQHVGYVETHGTGTSLGDMIEIEALNIAFQSSERNTCALGSVKTNIGHLDSAAGVAGLIKTALALYHGQIPPSLHFTSPNPTVDFAGGPFYVNASLREWEAGDRPRVAGVSSFGIGGTNAHMVLRQPPQPPPAGETVDCPQLLPVSAMDRDSLLELLKRLELFFQHNSDARLGDAAYTLQTGRRRLKQRAMVIAASIEEARVRLRELIDTESGSAAKWLAETASDGEIPLVFMFPGQGSQYVNMGLELYQMEPDFHAAMDACFSLFAQYGAGDLKSILYPSEGADGSSEAVNDTIAAQPLIFAFEYSLAQYLMHRGLKPKAMIGHSIGELVAACVAGVFSLEDAARIVVERGRLMGQMERGSMMSVPLSSEQLNYSLNEHLALAGVNAPESCTVSGPTPEVEALEARLAEAGITPRRLHTSHAFHSAMMEPMLDDFTKVCASVTLNPPDIPFVSNVSGDWITPQEARDPGYWAGHCRACVMFSAGVRRILDDVQPVLVEVGAGIGLTGFARRHMEDQKGLRAVSLARHPKEEIGDRRRLLEAIGKLWLYGREPDWNAMHGDEPHYRITLPLYPFKREQFAPTVDFFNLNAGSQSTRKDQAPQKRERVEDWLYTPVWKQEFQVPPVVDPRPEDAPVLAFHSHLDDARAFWRQDGDGVRRDHLLVVLGKAFNQFPTHFEVNPSQPDDWARLFEHLQKESQMPEQILYCGTLGSSPETDMTMEEAVHTRRLAFDNLLNLVRGFNRCAPDRRLTITVAVCNLFAVRGDEPLNPYSALVMGPVQVIPMEYPHIACRCVDLGTVTGGSPDDESVFALLFAELNTAISQPIVAFRGPYRYVPDIQPLPLPAPNPEPPVLKRHGVYLITGGLGGIGLTLARYLAENFAARLVLTGRTPLNQRSDAGAVATAIRDMETMGAEVLTLSVDVADAKAMTKAAESIRERFGEVNGIIHSAGSYDGGMIETGAVTGDSGTVASKFIGTILLKQVFDWNALDFFIACSSLSSIMPAMGGVAYCAANSFLDAFARANNRAGGTLALSLDWDTWQEVGMAVEAIRRRSGNTATAGETRRLDHPLFHRRVDRDGETAFVIDMRVEEQWLLNEHRAGTVGVLPGTTYLELAVSAFRELTGDHRAELRDVMFSQPFLVNENETRELHTILKPDEKGFRFVVSSRAHGGEHNGPAWIKHAEGIIVAVEASGVKRHDLDKWRELCPDPVQKTGETANKTLFYGPRWHTTQRESRGEAHGLISLDLGDAFSEDVKNFYCHPALLDVATSFIFKKAIREGAYLPFCYDRVEIRGHIPSRILSFATFRQEESTDKLLKCDVIITDEAGLELAAIYGFCRVKISPRQLQTPGSGTFKKQVPDQLAHGLLPPEGVDVFRRALQSRIPQIVVSTRDLTRLIKQTASGARKVKEAQRGAGIKKKGGRRTGTATSTGDVHEQLSAIWSQLLGVKEISIDDDFFEIGGDSLKVMTLRMRIQKILDVDIPISEFFNRATVRQQAGYINAADTAAVAVIEPVEEQPYYPVSAAQKRLFVLHQIARGSTNYNLPSIVRIQGHLDLDRVQRAFQTLVDRQESLRTSFAFVDEQPVQVIHQDVAVSVEIVETDETAAQDLVRDFCRPFDLTRFPLFRFKLLCLPDANYVFMIDVHHIIADARSCDILIQEFIAIYKGLTLPELPIQYKDFSAWQNSQSDSPEIAKQRDFWLEQLQGDLPVLQLPLDFPRHVPQSFAGDVVRYQLDGNQTGAVREFCIRQEATVYMFVLAVYFILLKKLSGQEDIIIGSTVLGRGHPDLEHLVGMFVNMLAVRCRPLDNMTFHEFLQQVKELSLQTYANQDYQFDDLVELLEVPRQLDRNPITDVGFSFLSFGKTGKQESTPKSSGGVQLLPYDGRVIESSKADISLFCFDNEAISLSFEYCTALFRRDTMERFSNYFAAIILSVLEQPGKTIAEIEMVTEGEKRRLTREWSQNPQDYTVDKTLADLFLDAADRRPDAVALVMEERRLTYGFLLRRAKGVAAALELCSDNGAGIGAVLIERSFDRIVAMLGLLIAGRAYLPIDTMSPHGRIEYLLKDSGTRQILIAGGDNLTVPEGPWDVIDIPSLGESDESLPSPTPLDPAYVLYTSGSTGEPKGVMVEHRQAVNVLFWYCGILDIGDGTKVLQLSDYIFDTSVTQIFGTLSQCGMLMLASRRMLLDIAALRNYIENQRIEIADFVPMFLNELIGAGEPMPSLRIVGSAGEALHDAVKDRMLSKGCRVFNMYGPTETAVYSLAEECGAESVTLGRPVANYDIYVLDPHLRPVPIGVAGEICIGGTGVARGYMNRPELTRERFVAHPFKPGERLYRTGDLGKWLPEGKVQYLGRQDGQVKIRGLRIECGEIEQHILSHPRVKEAAVSLLQGGGEEGSQLAAFVAAKEGETLNGASGELNRYLEGLLPRNMIPTAFFVLERLPRIPTGKVDRRALSLYEAAPVEAAQVVLPSNPEEELLLDICRRVMGVADISMDSNFFFIGGDSIKALLVSSRLLERRFKLDAGDMFQFPVLRDMARKIRPVERAIDQGPVEGVAPLTPFQSLFFQWKDASGLRFNQAVMLFRPQGFDRGIVERVFEGIVSHHDALRIVCRPGDGGFELHNRGLDCDAFTLEEFDLRQITGEGADLKELVQRQAERLQDSVSILDGPVARLGLFRTAAGDHLLVAAHHVVIDGVSWRILLEDVAAGYQALSEGEEWVLPPKTDSFLRWTRRLRQYAGEPELHRELPYWREVAQADFAPLLGHLAKTPRQDVEPGFLRLKMALDADATAALLTDAHQAYHTAVNDLLLAALLFCAAQWAGVDGLRVDLEGHGREELFDDIDISRTVGWFTSIFPVALTFGQSRHIAEVVKQVKETLRAIPRKGIGYGVLRYGGVSVDGEELPPCGETLVRFNFLGQFGASGERKDDASAPFWFSPLPKGESMDPLLNDRYALDINGMVANGILTVSFDFNRRFLDRAAAEECVRLYKTNLEEILHHCLSREESEKTASDFSSASLDNDEMETIFDELEDSFSEFE